MLTREQLLSGKSFLPFEEVNVPEFGGTIGVQGMTAAEALAYAKAIEKKGRKQEGELDIEALAKLVVRCVVDENRARIYNDDEWGEVTKWPHAALQRVAFAAMRLNNGSAEGNSRATPGDASSSGLH